MKQVLSALEYIHENGYAHGDIEGANLLLKKGYVYLIDFSLAVRLMNKNIYCEYETRAEKRHNGTI